MVGGACLECLWVGSYLFRYFFFRLEFAVVFEWSGRANKRGGERELIVAEDHMFWSWSVVAMCIVCTGI